MKRGFTLLELLVVGVMVAFITFGSIGAYSAAASYHLRILPEREKYSSERKFESYLQSMLERSFVDANTDTYFLLSAGNNGPVSTNSDDMADTVTFAAISVPDTAASRESELEFEDRNAEFGTQGGLAEISFSLAPVGDAGDKTGLFQRIQRPADGDYLQGGYEKLLKGNIASIGYEAWDGLQWVSSWDSTTMEPQRIPSLLRITYTLAGESEGKSHVFTVRLPNSDVTAENPVETGGGQ